MKLSKRLQMIATLVDIGVKVIDVGCDHAYLDIYLTLNNSNKCIATDINQNALNIAIKNIEKEGLNNKIETRLCDGLDGIDISSQDNIVISGMGTQTILNILKKSNLSDTLIISSNNDTNILRKEIISMGYIIDSEIFLIEKNKPYIIIKFKKGFKKYKNIDYLLGPILKYNKEYKKYLKKYLDNILKKISRTKIKIRFKYQLLLLRIKFLI